MHYLTCEVFRIQLPLRINVSLIGHYFMSLFVVVLALLIINVLRWALSSIYISKITTLIQSLDSLNDSASYESVFFPVSYLCHCYVV